MTEKPKVQSSFVEATHAYEHTVHAADQPRHRLDLTEAPRWPKPRPPAAPKVGVDGAAREPETVIHHRVDSPARLGFGFGFGFAAGLWTFRALIGLIFAAALLLALWRLLSAAL
ncbi:MAG TPA: hypothetical protein VGB82_06010 [Alphaproteobacteria bacterium]